jgi:hypothetical protein
MVMPRESRAREKPGTLSWARVADSALRQAARHEKALTACLSELSGRGEPTADAVNAVLSRARHHATRATGLAATAVRINRDPGAGALLAAALEHHERGVLLVEAVRSASVVAPDSRIELRDQEA